MSTSDLELVTLDELHEQSTEELLALIKKREGMDDARAQRALATIRLAERLMWRPGDTRVIRPEGDVVSHDELRELSTDELAALIMERGRMDESPHVGGRDGVRRPLRRSLGTTHPRPAQP